MRSKFAAKNAAGQAAKLTAKLTAKFAAVLAMLLLGVALASCSGSSQAPIGGDIVAPVTVGVNELQGTTVDLVVGQALNINTESLAVDSYAGEVANRSVAEFVPGRVGESAEFNPGVTALAEGQTKVTLTNERGGIRPLEFTVVVKPRS